MLDKCGDFLYSRRQKMNGNVNTAFTVADTSRIAGVTARRLDYWDRTGLLHPTLKSASGKGSRRLYSIQDLVQLKIISRLLASKLSLQRIRKSFTFIKGLSVPVSELVIISDGETIYACNSNDLIVDTLRQGQTVLKIIVSDLLKEVEEQVIASGSIGGEQSKEIYPVLTGPQQRK